MIAAPGFVGLDVVKCDPFRRDFLFREERADEILPVLVGHIDMYFLPDRDLPDDLAELPADQVISARKGDAFGAWPAHPCAALSFPFCGKGVAEFAGGLGRCRLLFHGRADNNPRGPKDEVGRLDDNLLSSRSLSVFIRVSARKRWRRVFVSI